MSTPSSTARSAVTPQVTASVIKFQCLYTHDLRRKSKRWQDGYLKFHSFNKRVMVYDDSGTFVGDHHWRSAEEVQDGDELELDKGVLIEVGERLSTTQTDITNLFDKKKSSQASPARGNQNPLQSQAPRISTAPTPAPTRTNPPPSRSSGTSQTFRSLNDLLGIKKNQPPAHPHGERPQPQANIQGSNEPAQKRQKVAISACTTPPSREDVMPQRPPATSITARPPPIKPLGPRPPDIPTSVGTKRKRSSEVVDLTELDDEPHTTTGNAPVQPLPQNSLKSPMPPPQGKPSRVPAKVNSFSASSKGQQPPKEKPAMRDTQESYRTAASRGSAPKMGMETAEPTGREETTLSLVAPDDMVLDVPVDSMPIFMQPPRKKLIHTALLPNSKTEKPRKLAKAKAPTNPNLSVEYAPSKATQVILEELAEGSGSDLENAPSSQDPATRRASSAPRNQSRRHEASLQKSLSDPSALTRPTVQTRPTLMRSAMSAVPEEAEGHEEGPWTSEALDLFDFWPPGRPKPSSN